MKPTSEITGVVADAVALQERDEFRESGWVKLIAPAKVNLHLAIGSRRPDGYHEAVSVMHALNVHDVVYLRRKAVDSPEFGSNKPVVHMVSGPDIEVPDLPSADNIASKAVVKLADTLGLPPSASDLEIRIEKNIPFQGGLGGGSTDAAAAIVGAVQLWQTEAAYAGLLAGNPVSTAATDLHDGPDNSKRPNDTSEQSIRLLATCERVARSIGADVAFFLHGGCCAFEGAGDVFVRDLSPSKRPLVLVKPHEGISTADAYRMFDEDPIEIPAHVADEVRHAQNADELTPFNNLAIASERLMPELADIRAWLLGQPGVESALLCGSGTTTFALCENFATACQAVAAAKRRGLWARATSFGSARTLVVSSQIAAKRDAETTLDSGISSADAFNKKGGKL